LWQAVVGQLQQPPNLGVTGQSPARRRSKYPCKTAVDSVTGHAPFGAADERCISLSGPGRGDQEKVSPAYPSERAFLDAGTGSRHARTRAEWKKPVRRQTSLLERNTCAVELPEE
jgi:hypothetical protein